MVGEGKREQARDVKQKTLYNEEIAS